MTTLSGQAQTLDWKEATWSGQDHTSVSGPKQTTAIVTTRWHGDLEADGEQRWLMTYLADDHAEFVGLERLSGTMDGRSGTLVLEHRGTFRDGAVRSRWSVVEGSGQDDLAGITGSGTLTFGPDAVEGRSTWTFEPS